MNRHALQVGNTVSFDGRLYKILEYGPRERFEKCNARLLGNGLVLEDIGSENKEQIYILEQDLD